MKINGFRYMKVYRPSFSAVTLYSDYKSSINYSQNISLNTDVTVVYLSTWFLSSEDG